MRMIVSRLASEVHDSISERKFRGGVALHDPASRSAGQLPNKGVIFSGRLALLVDPAPTPSAFFEVLPCLLITMPLA